MNSQMLNTNMYLVYLIFDIQSWDFGPIFRKRSASIFALKLQGTNPPMSCITTSLATVTFSVQIEDASLANAMSMTLLTTHFSFI